MYRLRLCSTAVLNDFVWSVCRFGTIIRALKRIRLRGAGPIGIVLVFVYDVFVSQLRFGAPHLVGVV